MFNEPSPEKLFAMIQAEEMRSALDRKTREREARNKNRPLVIQFRRH